LEKLIKDWRINPVYIEKYYNETVKQLPEIFKDIWRETLFELNIPMMDPEILEYIWKFELRYSYWQNLLLHSKEVAKISELIANELGYDWLLAKKAGLLHDIGKIDVNSGESHAKIWADILRKYKINDIIINAVESHHFEIEPNHPISWIVASADAVSAWREWVRYNSKELYIERIKSLENLIIDIEWVKKAYIMQWWREIWAFVNEDEISDYQTQKLNKLIKHKIEENLDYPGVIKIVTIRENKVISYIG
jgi:ribonuclease Y